MKEEARKRPRQSRTTALTAAAEALQRDGFWYAASFASPAAAPAAIMSLVGSLRPVREDVVVTAPEENAPDWRPFDQTQALGWHNDFCRDAKRPRYTFAFIQRGDPRGRPWGDWRVARVRDVMRTLAASERGRRAMDLLSHGTKPFEFDGEVAHCPVFTEMEGEPVLRFYGDSLRRGCARENLDEDVIAAIAAVEDAADVHAVECAAVAGALLVVDNWRSLHYRREQSVGDEAPRQALLMFAD